MNRSELVTIIAGRFPQLIARDIELSVATILAAITTSLASGGRAEIRGFGSFTLNYRPPRKGRNPKTGELVEVPAKRVPHFKAGKEMRERVDCRNLRRDANSPDREWMIP
jgi:integration host factor subunit beta